jgi:hypothetical protein
MSSRKRRNERVIHQSGNGYLGSSMTCQRSGSSLRVFGCMLLETLTDPNFPGDLSVGFERVP